MKQLLGIVIAGAAVLSVGLAQKPRNPFLGRWDIKATTPQATYPSWLEISEKDGALSAYIQPRSGGARRTNEVKIEGGELTLAFQRDVIWKLTAKGNAFTGKQLRGETVMAELAGVRAPSLDRPMPKEWTSPEPIFNGRDLTGWEPIGNRPSRWVVKDGELVNEASGANLKTTRKFEDFRLHIEFNCPEPGNSGIYLRGRYEVQVEYEPSEDAFHRMGSIYSHIAPAVDFPRKPGTWESFDITLVGRRVTIYRNGVKSIDNQEIPGITGGALDANEGEPGPFYIQGDHTGGLRYRNITVSVPKR